MKNGIIQTIHRVLISAYNFYYEKVSYCIQGNTYITILPSKKYVIVGMAGISVLRVRCLAHHVRCSPGVLDYIISEVRYEKYFLFAGQVKYENFGANI